ncbi:MAG: AmmeMemoRadiSam system protein B [Bacteroidales bacterium]|nr:AmmeMemoRadiSam system protein B [Bacteroidales bacterium]
MKWGNSDIPDRQPVVAGHFYPSDPKELVITLNEHFEDAAKLIPKNPDEKGELMALIVPHAGYVFSGTVAASAYLSLVGRKNLKRVFLIGSSHNTWFDHASVYRSGKYITPLGDIEVDSEIASKLITNHEEFDFLPEAHSPEHSLEVQLPFLQHIIKDNFKIVPILLGTHSEEIVEKIAAVLKPYFIPENLFIISTDLSHYPNYNDAVKTDRLTIDALCSNNPKKFILQLEENEKKKIYNLSTSMCGWISALTLLKITSENDNIHYHPILYQNSGDIPLYGDKSRVVGYQSVAVFLDQEKQNSRNLSEEDKEILLGLARKSIFQHAGDRSVIIPKYNDLPESLKQPSGAFVSIYLNKELKGCIGKIETTEPLYKTVMEVAVSAAFRDSRFANIPTENLVDISIEISVLSPLKKIDSIDEIIPGKHGILIKKDFRSGTYLPQVGARNNWTAEQYVSRCSVDKAGLGSDGWRDADIYIYEAIVFSDKK